MNRIKSQGTEVRSLCKKTTFRIIQKLKFYVLRCSFVCFGVLTLALICFAQQNDDLEFTLDITSNTIPLPSIFKPNIDLSGRGFHREASWPQTVATKEVLDTWQKDIGFGGVFRLQYNLWEINQHVKDKDLQDALLRNYENIIKGISEAGGIVILNIFGTPAGLGKVLDKTSPPLNLRVFKELVKGYIRNLSCDKRYNIWYEIWSAPDLDGFFLGRKQEYLNLYRQVAESVKELEAEFKIHIPLGGPGTSWWFQNIDGNTIIIPERSLIYDLIKFCYRHQLPLDFITWYGYSTDPKAEYEITPYNKTALALIRDWLTYFKFDRNVPLIVEEWNYDRGANVLPARQERSFICASFIPARLKNMYEAGLDYQLYFSLEDFQRNLEGVIRNTGIFWFDSEYSEYKGGPKSIYNVFRMFTFLGNNMFLLPAKLKDDFVGVIATKGKDYISILIYNYIDPEMGMNYLSRTIASLNGAERKFLLGLIKSEKLTKIIQGLSDTSNLRTSNKVKTLLKKARELNERAVKFSSQTRNIKISIKNLNPVKSKTPEATVAPSTPGTSNGVKEDYLYRRYAIDSSCSVNCDFVATEEKEVSSLDPYQEVLTLNPYSVNLIILKKKPLPEPQKDTASTTEQPVSQNAESNATQTNKQ